MAQTTIKVDGANDLDLLERERALKIIAQLPTKALKNMASLADNEKAKAYLVNDIKFRTLKTFL